MKKNSLILFLAILFISLHSCKQGNQRANSFQFKTGTFEIPAGDNYSKTTIIRKDSLQIETYENRIDTLLIKWENDFKYSLKMLTPKTDMDKNIIHVKITGVKNNSYDFIAKVGYSNFEQKGTIYKK